MTIELVENNYMEALLRAALLLGDLHRTVPVHEITISSFMICKHIRKLYPRCRIQTQVDHVAYTRSMVHSETLGENYLILFPI